MFYKEFMTWKVLGHPNLLPLLGVDVGDRFALVSEWMENGNINQFVASHQSANRFELVGPHPNSRYPHLSLTFTGSHSWATSRGAWPICTTREWSMVISRGYVLIFLIVTTFHSTLFTRQANILVDQTHHARLADFGLLSILPDTVTSNSCARGGTVQWMSPELINPDAQDYRRTKSSDCYALGMVVYEVLSGHQPFFRCPKEAVNIKVLRGDRPERPQGAKSKWFTDKVWGILEYCWKPEPSERPSIELVLQCLEEAAESWTPLLTPTVEDPHIEDFTRTDSFWT